MDTMLSMIDIETQIEINEMTNSTGVETPVNLPSEEITLLIEDNKLIELQKEDKFCKNILNMLANNKLHNKNPYYIENGILKRYIDDNKQKFEVIILPQTLIQSQHCNWHMKGWVIMEYLELMPC